ncbi:ParB/RepB/Spo0J family partition protein [Streptomyces sp. URMC 128]|uniref:ParB/RepB/Spo0J family partition protein n=1 Tax=Streptomyces sp. URMC 128 TaxID=3423404 RepID=UPI003F1DFAF1
MTTWTTLAHLHDFEPCKDYEAVLDALVAMYNSTEALRCWKSEAVPVGEIDRFQIMDDLDDHDGTHRVKRLRATLREGGSVPPVVLVHGLTPDRGNYFLLDGCHRFNAARKEGVANLHAWVAHIGCCGGPSPDMNATSSSAM